MIYEIPCWDSTSWLPLDSALVNRISASLDLLKQHAITSPSHQPNNDSTQFNSKYFMHVQIKKYLTILSCHICPCKGIVSQAHFFHTPWRKYQRNFIMTQNGEATTSFLEEHTRRLSSTNIVYMLRKNLI